MFRAVKNLIYLCCIFCLIFIALPSYAKNSKHPIISNLFSGFIFRPGVLPAYNYGYPPYQANPQAYVNGFGAVPNYQQQGVPQAYVSGFNSVPLENPYSLSSPQAANLSISTDSSNSSDSSDSEDSENSDSQENGL